MNQLPPKPWETTTLHNNAQVLKSDAYGGPSGANGIVRSAPVLPPRPQNGVMSSGYNTYGSYMPYSSKCLNNCL